MNITTNVFIVLAIMAGGILLQIFLSKNESKWFGLILPFITFSYSLLMVFSIALTDGMTWWDTCGVVASTLFISNIPTIILIAIYLGCREKIRQKKALEKMNIQDLE
jgi:peptidoglycan/LPS O-acetylase OafA/YrhL